MLKRFLLLVFLRSLTITGLSQTLGGNAVFSFIKESNASQLSALGGINVSAISNDVGMVFHNPSILRDNMNGQVSASFNFFLAGIKNYSITTAYHYEKLHTNLAVGVNFFDYGNIPQTDASGNVAGSFHPNDYVVQLAAGKQYKEKWFYGMTLKFINSQYAIYKSNGIGADVGVSYYDSAKQLQASVVVKNIGTQLKTYNGSKAKEELPFDLQAGLTKRLAKAPIQFSLTAHGLHKFNIRYNDTAFLAGEGVDDYNKKFTFDKLVSHLILSAQFYIKDKVEITTGYNFLRRKDLNVINSANGLNGFTMGAGLLLKNLQLRYATGFYQQNIFNQVSINFSWK